MADVPIDCNFPVWGLLPKKETGVVSFLNKNPNYDGRGTVIAILDSGVDPAAEGLKVTSTGETKVIERFDCSGCGDVDTSTVIKKVVDETITGITGRKLKIPEKWKNPSGEWRVGVLYPYSIYPAKVRERVQEHRKKNLWDVGHKPALAEAIKALQDFEGEVVSKNNLTAEEKLQKEELEARIEVLQNTEKKFTDLGPAYDCILFNDGEIWRACIDTTEAGELESCALLGEYSVTRDHGHLTPLDEMTVSINVHDEGQTLEVVGMCSTHGTHVAAIAAGYFPGEPERNGVSPGAKVVSLTIGDSRLGSMETGTAMVRACLRVMRLASDAATRVDVINMSYGEHAHWANAGRVGEIVCEVVNKYNVSWVVSAGNHGPALCTVGTPPDIAQPILIGVGAYVSPDMMSAAFSLRERWGGGAFSWSSRGPTADGAQGVTVAAPGGAVAAVARFTLRNSQLMNGTSMAAPHVAGAVAALISGLKQKELPYSPYSIKRALENSATYLPHVEPWAQGCGLLNIEKAFDILTTYHDQPEREVTFKIQCGTSNAKGILLRPKLDDVPKHIGVTIEPQFLQNHQDAGDVSMIPKQISFGVRLALGCASSWASAPSHLDAMNASRNISVCVDPTALPPGAHFTSVDAYDVNCVAKGPVFRIPITVLKPEPLPKALATHYSGVVFATAAIRRHFIIVPSDATWGVLKMTTDDREKVGRFLIHTMQILPGRSCRSQETHKIVNVSADAPTLVPFQLRGGILVEIAIARYWTNVGEMRVDYSVEMNGLRPEFGPSLVMVAADGVREVRVTSLRQHELQPSATLKYAEPLFRPTESKLSPLTTRDMIPPGRQIYQLINTYNFHLAKATEVSPIVSLLCDMLYESEFESQMWMLYNSCKQLMAVGDAYPSKYSVKLERGEYSVRLNVRHENRPLLEKLHELPLVLQQRLPQPLPLDVYASLANAISGGKKITSGMLLSGSVTPLYLNAVPSEKISRSNLTIGHLLTGTVTFAKDELARRADVYPLRYVVSDPPKRSPAPGAGAGGGGGGGGAARADKDKARAHDDYLDAYKELTTTWLLKLEGDKLEQVYEELVEKFPGYLGAHVAYLQGVDSPTDPKKLPHAKEVPDVTTAWCEQLVATADKVIKAIDQDKLLAYLGMKNDTRPDANKIKQEQEKQRGYLIDALCRKGTALCRLYALAQSNAAKDKLAEALNANVADLLKFTDLTDTKAVHYGVWHCVTLEQWGRAARLLGRLAEERPSREAEERLAEAYHQLRWPHLARWTRHHLPLKYPAHFRPF